MRRLFVLFVLLVVPLGSSALAQPEVSVRGNVGAAFFQSPDGLNTVLNSGVNLGVGTAVQVTEGLEIVLEGSYDRFSFNGDTFALFAESVSLESEVDGGDFNVQNLTLGVRYTFTNQSDVHPYFAGGVGVYRPVLERATVSESDQMLPRRSTVTNGYHAAIGSEFLVNETYSVFMEPRVVIVDTDGSELQVDTSTRYVTVQLGAEVRF
jgi:hypothetical protein